MKIKILDEKKDFYAFEVKYSNRKDLFITIW